MNEDENIESEQEYAALEAEIMDDETSTSGKQEKSTEFFGDAVCAKGCAVAFSMIAERKGKHWLLTEHEAKLLGGATDKVLAKWFPNGIGTVPPEYAMLGALAMIVVPRMGKGDVDEVQGADHGDS